MIFSPIPAGSGAFVLHKMLEPRIKGYRVCPYSPLREFFPATLPFLLSGQKPSLIHTAADYGIFFRRPGVPLVLTLHGFFLDAMIMPYSTLMQRIHYQTDLRWFTRASLKAADTVTAVSRFLAEIAQRELGLNRKIQVIYNGIDTAEFYPAVKKSGGKSIRVLFAGNLHQRKGAFLLPEIARRLSPGITIDYARGLRSKTLLPSVSNLLDLGNVPVKEMPALYRQYDMLLFPSVREGFGLVLAEAMSCGLPIVASYTSAIPELVIDGKGGFLCEPGNSDTFAEKINLLAEMPELRREMGEFNRARVEKHFTLERMIREYSELFERILDRGVSE
ncbi:Glycosyltransferase Family 4 [Syntrophus gentianae]|uniref:Glycosyltransferase Family 4 n=1 Tax=Syntrophus gentianae TaxID=43775 RepID=A0A1H7X791_9BACT|nr:glycosyltransferase family 4 protein [Syntrophus gentianae]SEM29494.1 Glycosyltransferase Family 4 [Syntrophus gentianae]